MVVTYAGYRFYKDDYHVHMNPRGEEYYWLGLHPLSFDTRSGKSGLSDYEAVEKGYVSITPIMLDMSAYESMRALKDWL